MFVLALYFKWWCKKIRLMPGNKFDILKIFVKFLIHRKILEIGWIENTFEGYKVLLQPLQDFTDRWRIFLRHCISTANKSKRCQIHAYGNPFYSCINNIVLDLTVILLEFVYHERTGYLNRRTFKTQISYLTADYEICCLFFEFC